MNLTIVIPFYNGHKFIGRLLEGLPRHIPVIVVDDVSDQLYSTDRANVEVIRLERKGYFAGAVNAGMRRISTDVLVLNQDAVLNGSSWLDLLADKSRTYAMIGERITGEHPAWENGYIQGTFMYIRRDAIEAVGYLNDELYPLWGGTCEYQLRLCRKGYKALPLPHISGFEHSREGKFGAAITWLLQREPHNRSLYIRTPPEISVIIPNYNYGHFLPDAVNSLIGGKTILGEMEGQTFQSFEVIIVDDASTDDSRQVIESLVDAWKGIRAVYNQRNMGTGKANDAGIRASYGKYITILGADDMMEPWRLEKLYKASVTHPHSMVYDDVMPVINGERCLDARIGVAPYDFDRLLKRNHVHAGIMFPKTAWQEVGGYPSIVGGREDWAMNIALGRAGYCGVYIPVRGYLYRRHSDNRTLRNTSAYRKADFLRQIMNIFPELYRGEKPMSCCGKGQTLSNVASTDERTYRTLSTDENMTLIQYTGSSYGTQTFYGPVTGRQYSAGLSEDVIEVDPRDLVSNNPRAPGLLQIRESGRNIFRVYAPVSETVSTTSSVALTDVIGVSKNLARKLKEAGISTVEDLADASAEKLTEIGISLPKAESIVQHAIELLDKDER